MKKGAECYIASLTLSVAVKFRIIETKPNLMAQAYKLNQSPLTSLIKMLKFCLQGRAKRVATLTEIENRNATTVGTVTSSRMVSGLAQHIVTVVFM